MTVPPSPGRELPSLEAWQEWRAALPAPGGWADVRGLPGPTKQRMRATLANVQQHKCALCLGEGLVLVLDHDHATGLARGMLCQGCNNREGMNRGPLFDAYRANPPAAGAGWIWDTSGSVARIMLARARAAGQIGGGISCFAPADLIALGRSRSWSPDEP